MVTMMRALLRSQGSTQYDPVEYLILINDAYNWLRQETMRLNRNVLYQTKSITIPASTTIKTLTELDAALTNALMLFFYDENGYPVEVRQPTEKLPTAITSGTREIILYGETLLFQPATASALTWTVFYIPANTALTMSAEPAIHPDYRGVIVYEAALVAKGLDDDDDNPISRTFQKRLRAYYYWLSTQRTGLPMKIQQTMTGPGGWQ